VPGGRIACMMTGIPGGQKGRYRNEKDHHFQFAINNHRARVEFTGKNTDQIAPGGR